MACLGKGKFADNILNVIQKMEFVFGGVESNVHVFYIHLYIYGHLFCISSKFCYHIKAFSAT